MASVSKLCSGCGSVRTVQLNMYRRTDCAPNCCTCGVGEGPGLRAMVGNDGDGDDNDDVDDDATYEDYRLTIGGP